MVGLGPPESASTIPEFPKKMPFPGRDTLRRNSFRIAAGVAGTLAGAFLASRYLNYHPRFIEQEEVSNNERLPFFRRISRSRSSPSTRSF